MYFLSACPDCHSPIKLQAVLPSVWTPALLPAPHNALLPSLRSIPYHSSSQPSQLLLHERHVSQVLLNGDRLVWQVQDRIASLNGRTVQLVIRQDRPGFNRLIGISVLQSAASAVLAPSLRHVANVLALTWRRRLTTAAHSRYFRGNTFYTTSQLAGRLFSFLAQCSWLFGSLRDCSWRHA